MRRLQLFMLGLAIALVLSASAMAAEKETSVRVDKEKRTVTIDAKIAPRKLEDPKFEGKIWPVEVVACWAYPKGQKSHETVINTDCKPSDVHKALEGFGLKPGKPAKAEGQVPQGPEVKIYLEIPGDDGRPRRVPIERTMIDPKTNKPLPKSVRWRFTGSAMVQPDPDKPEKVYGADRTGTLIAIFPVTDETVFQTNLTLKEEKYLKLETNSEVVPKVGTAVKLVIEVPAHE